MNKMSSLDASLECFNIECSLVLELCRLFDTPRSHAVHMMIKEGLWDDYLSLGMPDPASPSFSADYLVTRALSKSPHLTTSFNKRHIAEGRWHEAERRARQTNDAIISKQVPSDLLYGVSRVIAGILGPLRDQDLDSVAQDCRFGPGATSAVTGGLCGTSRKFASHNWDVSLGLLPYFSAFVPSIEGYRARSGALLPGNKVTFVPKNSKTDRAIAIEPHTNIYVQLGIGALLRRRLLRHGLDITNQKFKNRAMVMRANELDLCTIDLSMASDTIAYMLVLELLPFDWFHLLDIARSEASIVKGELIPLQKFSSMGNGFTFELETLIFYAICLYCGVPDPCVFGDDIIVPKKYAKSVMSALWSLGFIVNDDKTFLAGRFYESCGIDCLDDRPVHPFYLKGQYHDRDHAIIEMCNKLRLWSARCGYASTCHRVWNKLLSRSAIARKTFTSYPDNEGVWRNFDECTPSLNRYGLEAYSVKVYHYPSVPAKPVQIGSYLAALALGSPGGSRLNESYRGRVGKPRLVRRFYYGAWTNLDSWTKVSET